MEAFINFTKRPRISNNHSMYFYYNYYREHLLPKVTKPEDLFISKELARIWVDAIEN